MALPKAGVELVAEGAAAFVDDMGRADRAHDQFARGVEQGSGRISASGQIIIGALRTIGTVAVEVAAEAARAVVDFVSDSVTAAGDFEAGLNRLQSVAGDGFNLEEARAQALELGAATQFSAGQALDAMIELTKGGVDFEAVMGSATDATLTLAAAGELELARAADIVARQLGVWGDRGVDAAQVADLMAQAANASTVGVEDLALGMANVGSVAETAGLSFRETTQIMALIAPGFSSAADAGTSFKAFLNNLIPTTSDAAGMMQQLGLYSSETGSVFYDATGSFVGMEQASQLLYEATQGLSEAERSLALETIFGSDAQRAAALIAQGGAAAYTEMGAAMDGAGSAAEQAAERNRGFNFALESLQGSIETVQIVLGSALLPVLTDFVTNAVIPAVNQVLAFAQAMTDSGDPIGYVTGLLPGLQGATQTVTDTFRPFIDAAQTIGAELESRLPGAIQAASTYWDTVLAPVFEAGTDLMQQHVIPALGDVATWLADNLPVALDAASAAWNTVLLPVLQTVSGFLAETVIPVIGQVVDWLREIIPPAAAATGDAIDAARATFEDIWDFVDHSVLPLFRELGNLISAILEPAIEGARNGFEDFLDGIRPIWTFIQDNFNPIVQTMTDALLGVGGPLQNLGTFLDNARDGFSGVSTAIDGVVGWLRDLATTIRNLPDLPFGWMPHSPPPIEVGMRGIADAIGVEVVPALGSLMREITAMERITPPAAPQTWNSSVINGPSFTFGNIAPGVSTSQIERIVDRALTGAAQAAFGRGLTGG